MTVIQSAAKVLLKGLRATWSLFWMFLVTFGLAITLTLLVKGIFGDFEQFKTWQESHFAYLLLWRLFVYVAIGWSWISIRPRFVEGTQSNPVLSRLLRCELLLILVVCLFEIKHAGLF